MRQMKTRPDWSAVRALSSGAVVDRKNNVIRGYVVAQRGHFKSQGRGQFDDASLATIVKLYKGAGPMGLKSRFTHPTMSDDGLGSFLGRSRNARLDEDRVRADLHLDPSSFVSPKGNLGQYVLDLAASDPDALSSSLVLQTDQEEQLDEEGRPRLGDDGEPLPPVWRPTKLMASDIVDTGDAVDGLLSAGIDPDGLPLGALWKGCEMLDRVFADQSREVIEARLSGFVARYLAFRFGVKVPPTATPATKADEIRLKLLGLGR